VGEHERIVGKLNGRQSFAFTIIWNGSIPWPIEGEAGALAGVAAHTPNPIAIKAGVKANRVVLRIWVLPCN